jgi:probable rRNA maturation factor
MNPNRTTLHLFNRQKKVPCRLPLLKRQLESALPLLPASRHRLPGEIEISLVTASAIRHVHRVFFQDDTVTDVITFPHGEILICPAIAVSRAKDFGQSPHQEILTYGLHGLLHLLGWDDQTPRGFQRMAHEQARLVKLLS